MFSIRVVDAARVTLILPLTLLFSVSVATADYDKRLPIKVGWIGGMTGPTAKWGSYQAALLGVEKVNGSGGINGRKLEVIYEDARCNGAYAVSAFQKLTQADGVSFILGGHCSPESLAFAPLAEKKGVVSIAAVTSSPKLTTAGDYVFRVTPVSTRLADLLAPYATNRLKLKKAALIYELTDYVEPVAEHFRELFKKNGGTITSESSFVSGETDFKSILLKASRNKPDILYLGVQAPDTALLLMKQIKELKLKPKIFGNEQFAGAFLSAKAPEKSLLESVVFAEPDCDFSRPSTKEFASKYKERYKVESLPFGCYTAEPYDAMLILANALKKCGENPKCVKADLYSTKDYQGASGTISFDKNGDVDKPYLIKKILGGAITIVE